MQNVLEDLLNESEVKKTKLLMEESENVSDTMKSIARTSLARKILKKIWTKFKQQILDESLRND